MRWLGWKSRARNRRIERREMLDVKLRSQQARNVRLGRCARALAVVFGLLALGFALWRGSEALLAWAVYRNPAFAVKGIDIETNGEVDPDWIRRWAGVRMGENLFALDLGRVRRDLRMVPVIEEAWIERVLPDRLRIRVTEREPVASVVIRHLTLHPEGGLAADKYYLDASGFVMQPLAVGGRGLEIPAERGDLPQLTGIDPFALRPGRRVDAAPVQAALELLRLFEQSPMYGLVELARLDVGTPEVLVATTDAGCEITFGLDALGRQLRRWRRIHEEGQRLGWLAARLDLAVSNNLPVVWIEAGQTPPGPAKGRGGSGKNQRKRHV